MCGKVVVLRSDSEPGTGSAAGGSYWQISHWLGLAFLLSTLQCCSCVVVTSSRD